MISTKASLKWWSHLVFHDLDLVSLPTLVSFWSPVPLICVLPRTSKSGLSLVPEHVHCSYFWVSKHDSTFHALKIAIVWSYWSKHQVYAWPTHTSLQTNVTVSNIPINFRTRYKGRNWVDNDKVNCTWVNHLLPAISRPVRLSLVVTRVIRQCSHQGLQHRLGQEHVPHR